MIEYLYNGVRLPKLPEVEGYPYKYVFYQKYNVYRYEIVYGAEPITAETDLGGYGPCVIAGRGYGKKLYILNSKNIWVENDTYIDVSYKGDMSFQWTNHDILYESSTNIYLAKSPDPVPVLRKGKLQCSTLNLLIEPSSGGDTWTKKTWEGSTSCGGRYTWTDGTRFYYSYNEEQYVLNGDTWEPKTWNGLTSFLGSEIWTDGTNIYCSHYASLAKHDHYVLNGDTWEVKTWNNAGYITGAGPIWTDGTNIYYSVSALLNYVHYVLDGNTWVKKEWEGTPLIFGEDVWTDGTDIYCSWNSRHYVLKDGSWIEKAWSGLTDITDFEGKYIWTDGTNIYYSDWSVHYVLNGDAWEVKKWRGLPNFSGDSIWTDGTHIYYGSDYVLTTRPPLDPASMLMGWLVGRRIAGMRRKEKPKVSIAYLYNGVQLPALPEWDKETYPYVAILNDFEDETVYLYCFKKQVKYSFFGNTYGLALVDSLNYDFCYKYNLKDGDWVSRGILSGSLLPIVQNGTNVAEIVWSSFDIYNSYNADIHLSASEPVPVHFLTFTSAEPFSIAVNNATKNWDGVLEYSTDAASWTEWDGTTAIASAEHGGEQKIYMRGSGNTVITGSDIYARWVLNGVDIRCDGNIETLLDYETVANGEHPAMGDYCYYALFNYDCTALISAPSLPATTLTDSCYAMMFRKTSLTTAPVLPATTLAKDCYASMFHICESLTTAPALPATTLAEGCYRNMFYNCSALTTLPELPATTLAAECYRAMFDHCTGIKISTTQTGEYTTEYRIPSVGTGTTATYALSSMFIDTGGTFTGTPSINTTYYTANEIIHPDASV